MGHILRQHSADHRQVHALFRQYADTPDPYLKQIIAEHIFAELTLYMLLEETVFSPAFAEQADEEGKRRVSDALQEGFVLPLFVTCIGRNGSMMYGRYDDIEATGRARRPTCGMTARVDRMPMTLACEASCTLEGVSDPMKCCQRQAEQSDLAGGLPSCIPSLRMIPDRVSY